MRFTFTLEDWIFILRAWLDESYPLDQGKSQDNNTDFFSVATKMCEFAGFATTGIEEELAEIKASSPS